MIDIHCHILPGMDDGPADMEESIEMARVAVRDGIKCIVATPHLKDSIYPASLIRGKVDELNARLAALGIELKVLHGADINSMLAPSLLRDYTINGTDYLLIEFPHSFLPRSFQKTVFRLIVEGFRPIVTHPERNGSVVMNPELVFDLVGSGSLIQITAGSLTGEFGPDIRECALFLLESGLVSFIATDAHSSTGRQPVLSRGLMVAEKVLGRDRASMLVSSNPGAVIEGSALNA